MIRLFVDADLVPQATIIPAPAQTHYLLTVMRRRHEDPIRLFNGRDGEWSGVLRVHSRRQCHIEINDRVRHQVPESGPALLFAPIKRARLEILVEKATELGVATLVPVATRRAVVDRINAERLRAIAVEAAEQCGRLTVPEILPLQPLERALAGRQVFLADESGQGVPLLEAIGCGLRHDLLIGPEGGFTSVEREDLRSRSGVVAIDLGPLILRAETAAIVALAVWQAAAGVQVAGVQVAGVQVAGADQSGVGSGAAGATQATRGVGDSLSGASAKSPESHPATTSAGTGFEKRKP